MLTDFPGFFLLADSAANLQQTRIYISQNNMTCIFSTNACGTYEYFDVRVDRLLDKVLNTFFSKSRPVLTSLVVNVTVGSEYRYSFLVSYTRTALFLFRLFSFDHIFAFSHFCIPAPPGDSCHLLTLRTLQMFITTLISIIFVVNIHFSSLFSTFSVNRFLYFLSLCGRPC